MSGSLVIMGVSGCGKSTLGLQLSERIHMPFVEGDDHHCADNREKMKWGTPLTDQDRARWLTSLGLVLQNSPCDVVLACSALKKKYRDLLRNASPGLRFVYLELTPDMAFERVSSRALHFFPPHLVNSPFEALESPVDELGVLGLLATQPLEDNLKKICEWL